jgi:hypothetical protein
LYQLFVGEIGYDRKEFLFELKQWEIILIIRGFRRRQRTFCDMVRLQTYINLMPQTNLKENGIMSPSDLIKFPWDDDNEEIISEEDVEDLTNLIAEANKRSAD